MKTSHKLAVGAGALSLTLGIAEWAMQKRGDTNIVLDMHAVRDLEYEIDGSERLVLRAVIPFVHRGKQQGCVLDCTARVLPDGNRYGNLDFEVRVNNLSLPRHDGYFEAIMFKTKETLDLGLEISVRGKGDLLEQVRALKHLPIEIHYSFYMRSPLQYRRRILAYPVEKAVAVAPRVPQGGTQGSTPETAGDTSEGGSGASGGGSATAVRTARERKVGCAIPIRTHILGPQDAFAATVERYVLPHAKPGDMVAIAESALAIMQNRLYHVEDLQPRFLARKLCRLLDPDSSLSTPYGLEMAFAVCGTPRILAAFAAGVVGKVLGRSGDFYRVAGPDVACIDDASGTLPPYDKYVVLGPINEQQAVNEIKERFGLEACIVDANDLKKVYVVACSDSSLESWIQSSLIDNPQGNAGEQTPIVLIPRSV